MLGRIVSGDSELRIEPFDSAQDRNGELSIDDPNLSNLVAEVSCKEVKTYRPATSVQPLGPLVGRLVTVIICNYE